jgi:hypothetical protein
MLGFVIVLFLALSGNTSGVLVQAALALGFLLGVMLQRRPRPAVVATA